jgi:lipopolysaccharide transport system permease protein
MNLKSLAKQAINSEDNHTTVIEAEQGWRLIDWRELWKYRDLFFFLVWRDIKIRYAQSILGIGWAVIQPVFTMVVFTIVFGNLARVDSEGVPYAIFSFVALVPWTYFSSSLSSSSSSLISASGMITKVYFPRLVIPIAPVLANLVDFGISLLILFGMMIWFGIMPTPWALALPLLILLMMLSAAGAGMWLTAMSIQYRDIRYGLSFFVRLLMYASPVIYATGTIPERFQIWYALNPMVGVIEGFRAALVGTKPMPWAWIGMGTITAVVLFITGALYFRRMERVFADVA